jgi:pimeloyl-ACP methyl ester carboxylesterase
MPSSRLMAEVTANGVRFHVQRLGAASPVVVMIHGMVMDNLSSLYYTIANPIAQHAEVVLYDLRGHGRSERPDNGYRIADSVDDLIALLDELALDQPVHLLGNSYGGTVALAAAVAHPERVAGLVLIEAHFAVEGWGEHMAGSLELAGLGLEERDVQNWLEEQGGRKLNRMARRAEELLFETTLVADMRETRPFAVDELRHIACPTLALYGEHSDVIDRARDLEAHVPGCELHIYRGASHSVLMESSERIRADVLAWLGAVDGPDGGPGADRESTVVAV